MKPKYANWEVMYVFLKKTIVEKLNCFSPDMRLAALQYRRLA